ncbi:hypothetical protein [Actinokineospora sp. UTMC 2448]|uniref:hypothetical protein n=1 Tax=Actinokineospora sp. UTMC 2448 TaxID=2268449 RepID=UPI002164ED23|nr:hypothetical protein [Actinokineospora sp. UTMC 2448]
MFVARSLAVVSFAALALVSAGCAEGGSPVPAAGSGSHLDLPEATTTTTTTPTTTKPATSERGNVPKKLGEEAGVTNEDGATMLTFTLDSIDKSGRCTGEFAEKPENGHFLILHLRVTTAAEFDEMVAAGMFNPYDFAVVGPDGVTETNLSTVATYSCLNESAPLALAPGSKYRFSIVLDSRSTKGVLTYRPGFMASGWEWPL